MAFLKTSETSASAALNSERMFRSSARPRWLARCSGDSVRSRKSVKIRTCLKTPTARLPDFNPVRCGVTASTGTVSSSIGLKRIRLALNPNIFPAPRKIPKASSASCWACLSGLCINPLARNLRAWTLPSAVSAAAMRNDRTRSVTGPKGNAWSVQELAPVPLHVDFTIGVKEVTRVEESVLTPGTIWPSNKLMPR